MDSDTENIEEFSGIEQPPLLEQIKRILDEYRNDVQIIKELIQNADDANATEMRILYEGRIINPEREDESEYCRFLRAPALVFYNNKTFTKDDWRGIRSIYTSVKRDDPLKIGRFGLGFKSVFHLTDYPCIISGQCALFINPHAKEFGKICVMVKLKDLTKWHRLNENDYRNSLIKTFGFDDDTLTSGFYNGTMFWFPLRQHFSSLSENTYPEENVYNLLHAFISESDRSLLFLKTLCSITLYVDMQDSDNGQQNHSQLSFKELNSMNLGKEKPYFIVSVNNKSNDIEKERALFLKELQDIENEVPDVSKQWVFDITVQTLANTFEEDRKIAKSRWLIVNYLKGGDISDKLGLLMKDKELGYPHIVGVAASIDEQNNFTSTSGHVFCYQPLPQENVSMTGLPVHINGFFSLSQNRRHVRWPDQGDMTMGQGDKKIEWNLELLTQVLPEAYEILLKELANLCQKESNPDYLLKALYSAVPDLLVVNEHWHTLAEIVLELCNDKSIFYTKQDGGRWIQIRDAVFTKSRQCAEQTNLTDEYMDTVFDLLILDKVNAVVVPDHVSESFKKKGCKVTYAKPAYLKSHMALTPKSNYKSLNLDKKQDLFEFIMLDSSTEGLEDLELLPLADGTFTTFSTGEKIILETNDIVETFPGQESNFVHVNLRKKTTTHLTELVDKGGYCLAALSDDATVTMVTNVLQNNFGEKDTIHVKESEAKNWKKWVRDIWNLVQKRFRDSIKKFIDCPIFPIISVDNGENLSDFLLIKLSTNILYLPLLNQIEDRVLIKRSFDLLSVSVTENIPFDIDVGLISNFLFDETSERITSLFEHLSSQQVCKFNNDTCDESSAALLRFLAERIHTNIRKTSKQTIRKLRLFRGHKIQTQSGLVSLNEIDDVYDGKEYPVHFPSTMITLNSNEEKILAERLDANVISELELVRKTIRSVNEYTSNEKEKFVFWIILKGEHFKYHDVQEKLKHIVFLKSSNESFYMPSDLFDPSEKLICDLFKGEALFPELVENEHILSLLDGLKSLGLKTIKDLTVHDVNSVSDAVNQMANGNLELDLTKCKALLHVMNEHSHLVQNDYINTRRCIFIEDTMEDIYSKNIPLKNRQKNNADTSPLICTPMDIHSAKHVNLIGSVMFIIDSKRLPHLSDVFHWNSQPKVCMVLEHLQIIVKEYQPNLKASYLPIVTCIYEWLSKQDEVRKDDLKMMIENRFLKPHNSFVWDGSIFQPIETMYIEKSKGEINLMPFKHPLPEELQSLADFFLQLGCLKSIGYDTYVDILQQIKNLEQQTIDNKDVEERFTEMAISILNRIKKNFFDDFVRSDRKLFFPTIGENGGIHMMPTESCTYCDEQWLKNMDFQFDGDIYYIHPDLPISTAETLGVPSLRQQMMSDTEAFAEWGQEEPLTRRLRNLLKEGYVDGFSVAKELFQNADDAGAKTLCILFDERENNEAKTGLISERMAECQGPAIWAYNDAQFTESDFKNITKLSGATKEDDSTKIGKFGLGFCAVYNITDVPSFVSGENMVIFDPDMSHLGNVLPGRSPGLRVNFNKMSNLKLLKSLRNQFLPFEGIFDCRILDIASPSFNGTLFRLPLRNKASDICDVVYTTTEVKQLFEKIMSMAANMLIFNQNVVHFKLLHIPKTERDPKKATLLFEVCKNAVRLCAKDNAGLNALSMLVEASERKKSKTLLNYPLQVIDKVSVHINSYFHSKYNVHTEDNGTKEDWFVSWSTGIEENTISMSYEEKGTLPLGAVAIPVKYTKEGKVDVSSLNKLPERFYQTGHLFFFLPLPIEHKFPFHINSQFTVTSDRRQLKTATEDDKNVKMKEWNRYLLEDSVTQALLFLLTQLHLHVSLGEYHFPQVWPKHDTAEILEFLPAAFYQNVVREGFYDVFEKNGQWFDISKCVFIERQIRSLPIGEIVFDVLSKLTEYVIDVSDNIYDMLKQADGVLIDRLTVSMKTFFLEYLFPSIETFSSGQHMEEKVKQLICYAIDLQNEKIDHWLKQNKCIPSQPNGILKCPKELINTNSYLAEMFVAADGFFPEIPFTEEHVSMKLQKLGLMFNVLTDGIVINRANSIEILSKKCLNCAVKRSAYLQCYLSRNKDMHESIFCDLGNLKFIPVLAKPKDWVFEWHADMFLSSKHTKKCKLHKASHEKCKTSFFDRPANMYFSTCKNIVGCVAFIMDDISYSMLNSSETKIFKDMLEKLRMKGRVKTTIEPKFASENLISISTSFQELAPERIVSSIVHDIYQYFEQVCKTKDKPNDMAISLRDEPIVYVEKQFVKPMFVSKCSLSDCKPYIYCLDDSPLKNCPLFCKCLKIADYFDPYFLLLIIQGIKNEKKENSLSKQDIRTITDILYCFKNSITVFYGQLFDVQSIVKDEIEAIYGPDENGVLQNCQKMCFNDYDEVAKSDSMIYAHKSFPADLAKFVGVKPKLIHCLEESSEDFEDDFFQNEPLITRLNSLVDAYPFDSGILKELIQNADDAKATEIHFVKDYKTHPQHNIIDQMFQPLQGPALVVCNDSAFSNDDIKGIQRLGRGNKSDDPSKTGRYGVGFNAVYNLTDAPSFFTKGGNIENGETLCFFDPLAKFVPTVSKRKPGKRYKDVQIIRKRHADMMSGYHEKDLITGKQGTVFRFPLRTDEMAKTSEIKDKSVSMDMVSDILKEFSKDLNNVLLFLKNLKTVKVSSYKDDRFILELQISLEMSERDSEKRKEYVQKQHQMCAEFKKTKEAIFNFDQFYTIYELTINVRKRQIQQALHYIVVQILGFTQNSKIDPVIVEKIVTGKLGLLPHGGIALQANMRTDTCDRLVWETNKICKAFCFLPLPIKTGLPVHVHGYFALDHETRRSLWKSEVEKICHRTLWNNLLLEHVISMAYVHLLHYSKNVQFRHMTGRKTKLSNVMSALKNYQSLFPLKDTVSDEYWKLLMKSVYRKLVNDHAEFLPVTNTIQDEYLTDQDAVHLTWTSLNVTGLRYPAYIREEEKHVPYLNNILQRVGMRLVYVSKDIQDAMHTSGVSIENLTPLHVIDFLCISADNDKDCNIKTERHVMHTSLKTVQDAAKIMSYCLNDEEKLILKIENIPFMVTGDSIVRTLPASGYFYLELRPEFCGFFPTKQNKFLHSTIAKELDKLFCKNEEKFQCKLKRFKLIQFVALVKETKQIEDNCTSFKSWNRQDPTEVWIQTFWEYFIYQLENESGVYVGQQLQVMWTIPLIPVTKSETDAVYLAPPCKMNQMLNIESFKTNRNLYKTFQKMSIPHICESIFCKDKNNFKPGKAFIILSKHVPNYEKPKEVLESLYLNIDDTSVAGISDNDLMNIIQYFNDCIDNCTPSKQLSTLEKMPIFLSHFGKRVMLKTYDRKYVVPFNLPKEGLNDIAEKAGVIFLRNTGHDKIFKHLNVPKLSLVQVYTQFIVPKHDLLQRECFYDHLEFLSRNLNHWSIDQSNRDENTSLLSLLKRTAFVKTQGELFVKVCDLFDPVNPIFRKMCKVAELAPIMFSDINKQSNILQLFRQIGLKSTMTVALFERFAKEVALSQVDTEPISVKVSELSKLITTNLISMGKIFFQNGSFENLAKINFVTPHVVPQALSSLKEQFNSTKLICFKGSVVTSKENIAWTVLNILPQHASPSEKEAIEKLQICQTPSIADLVSHCMLIGENINTVMANLNPLSRSRLKAVMDEIYYTLKNAPDNDTTNQRLIRLSNIPTVYFPDMKLVVPAKRVVISCKEEEEIHPYLLKCPDSLSLYTNVFIRLGASKDLSCDSFACVLRCLKEDTLKAGGPELTPKEYSDAIKAMQYFFRYLAFETKTITISGESLYFLSEAETIENSNMLVVSNNMYFKSALDRSDTDRRMFLIGFGNLFEKNMRIDNCVENLQYLPDTQKPYLLTEVVVERVVLDNIKKMARNEALKLEEFIHGTDFLYGFLRLYRHTLELQGIKWNIEIETKFANHMKKVTFEQCSGIETVLYMKKIENGRKLGKEVLIENTNEKRYVHTEISDEVVCVYFDTSDSTWKQNVKKEITVYLNGLTCEKSFDAQTSLNLSEIIGMFDTPREIEMYLSQARIKEYTFETEILDESYSYPIPGDIVEERFHRYLDNDFGLIYEFDFKFVALEVDDPSFDAELEEDGEDDEQQNGKYTPTYMYVHIIRQLEPENELPLFQEYEIDCGSGTTQTVKGFQLYKFVRDRKHSTEKGTNIVVFSGDTNTAHKESPKCFPQTFQEACKEVRKILTEAWKKHENDRKRIVKRLMLKWHPDKNPDNVNFCTKVFQYIQQCLNRLDNGLDLQEEDDDSDSHTTGSNFSSNTSGTYWSSSGSYGNTRYDRYWRRYDRGRRYNESRYSNTSYNYSSRGNNSSRGTSGYYRNFHSYWRSSRRYTHTSYEPYNWYSMARIWHKQAELDLRQARESIELQEHPQYNWSCYNAHQAAEKALKAAWYSKDAKKIGISVSGHDLEALARDLDPSLSLVAREMSNLTGDYSAMRYPRTHTAQVPSEIYTRTKATGMIELAQKIITIVQNSYIR